MQRRPVSTFIALLLVIPPYIMTAAWFIWNTGSPWNNVAFWLFIGVSWWFHCRGEYIQTQREITQRKIKTLERICR